MSFKPVTVNTPSEEPAHILAQDDATLYHGIIGQDCVLDIGSKMEAVIIDNNTVRIQDGAVMVQGHLGRIPHGEYEDLHIENGVAGQKRHDLIVARFETTAGIDTYELAVIKGVSGAEGRDPDITSGNLNAGDMLREYPLYRVKIDGILLAEVEKVYTLGSTIDFLHQSLESHLAEYSTFKNNISIKGKGQRMLAGVSVLADGELQTDVVFSEAFTQPPVILTTLRSAAGEHKRHYVTSPTTTGFTAVCESAFDNYTAKWIYWIAIGR